MPPGTVKLIKSRLKDGLKSARTTYAKAFHAYTPDDLRGFLCDLGIAPGDTLFVHSSYDAFTGFSGKPTDVMDVLTSLVSANGVLLMPTMPFTGTAVDYVLKNPVLDVVRTPSRMGLLSELFRRSTGVLRSAHPTHPIAVRGDDAVDIVTNHHAAMTPCGRNSPFDHLVRRNGRILLLGADISSLTFYHWIEEDIEARLPQSPFTHDVYTLATRLPDRTEVTTRTRLFDPAVSRRRNLHKLIPEIKRLGGWREARIGSIDAVLLDVALTRMAAMNLAEQAIFCYD